MSLLRTDAPLAVILATAAWLLHSFLHQSLMSYAPLPVLLSLLWTWNLARPAYYVVGLAAAAELFSTLPLGMMTVVVLLPPVTRRFWGLSTVDVSFTYLLLVSTTVSLQSALLFAYDTIRVLIASPTLATLLATLPWLPWITTVAFTTLMAFLISIIRSNQPGFLQSEARAFRMTPYGRS